MSQNKPPVHNPFKRNVRIPGVGSTRILFAAAFDGKQDHQLTYTQVQRLAKGPLAKAHQTIAEEPETAVDERTLTEQSVG